MADQLEPFVTTEEAARFLAIKPRTLAALARKGLIPAHPLGSTGKGERRTWRFLLSELSAAMRRQPEKR